MKNREPRYPVQIPARIRWDGRWVAASVRNISARGLMLRTPTPPPPGTYVEIQLGSGAIAARSMWTADQSCGLRSQDKLDISSLRNSRSGASEIKAMAVANTGAVRRPCVRSAHEAAERSRRMSALFQFAVVVLVGAGAAGSLGYEVYKVLSVPMAAVEQKLGGDVQ